MHAGANLSPSALSSDIATAAFRRNHEIAMRTYFEKAFMDIFFMSIVIFQNSLNFQQFCELWIGSQICVYMYV